MRISSSPGQPRPVIDRDQAPVEIDSLGLPHDVVVDDQRALHDILGVVAAESPDKNHRKYDAAELKKKQQRIFKSHPGRTSSEVMASLVQHKVPVVVPPRLLNLDGTLQEDVMEIFSPPRSLEHTKKFGLRGNLSVDLGTGWDLSLQDHQSNLLMDMHRRRPNILFLEPPLHMVILVAALERETHAAAGARGSDGISHQTLGVLLPDPAHPIADWPCVRHFMVWLMELEGLVDPFLI